jgi:hypothetical protein
MAAMTKDRFRRLVMGGMESLMTMPDDLWHDGFPVIRLTTRQGEVVIVGIEEGRIDGNETPDD